jgi:hypothetical protein
MLVARRYSKVIDLRTGLDEPAVVLDAKRVAELADRYVARRREDPVVPHTDLLLLPVGLGDVPGGVANGRGGAGQQADASRPL